VPNELVLSVIVREHDEGSTEEARQKVLQKAMELASAAAQVYTLASGDADGGTAAPEWSKQVKAAEIIAGWVAGLFGLGDDAVGHHAFSLFPTIGNNEPPKTPAIVGSHLGNPYNLATPVIGSDSGGKYTVYFLVTVYDDFLPRPVV
jgi:hypothetical protein